MKRWIKILCGVAAVILIAIIVLIANSFVGNPISKAIANKSAEKYISSNYRDLKLELTDASYSFKDGMYHVRAQSPTSIDTNFNLAITSNGKIRHDSYENDVVLKWNIYSRIDRAYFDKVKEAVAKKDFPFKSDIGYGDIMEQSNSNDIKGNASYGLVRSELILDKQYDISELGKQAGNIVLYIESDDVSIDFAKRALLDVKEYLGKNSVTFFAIDLTIEKPRLADGMPNPDSATIRISHFLYTDIYEQELEQRITENAENLKKYYEEQDKIKNQEISMYEDKK